MKLIVALLSLHLTAAGLAAFLYHTDNRILPTRLNHADAGPSPVALEEGYFEKTAVTPTVSMGEAPGAKIKPKNLTVAPDVAYSELAKAWIAED